MHALVRVVVATALVACGGGGGGEPGGDASPPDLVLKGPTLLISAIGDSTQVGLSGDRTRFPDPTPPGIEAERLLRLWTGRNVVVRVDAYGGTTTTQWLAGTDQGRTSWSERVGRAHIVVIKPGINDARREPAGGPAHSTPEEFEAKVAELVRVAQAAGRTVLLETPNPVLPDSQMGRTYFDMTVFEANVAKVRAVGAAAGVPVCDHYAMIRAAKMDTVANLPDGVHPTPDLYRQIGRQQAECLMPLVSAL